MSTTCVGSLARAIDIGGELGIQRQAFARGVTYRKNLQSPKMASEDRSHDVVGVGVVVIDDVEENSKRIDNGFWVLRAPDPFGICEGGGRNG